MSVVTTVDHDILNEKLEKPRRRNNEKLTLIFTTRAQLEKEPDLRRRLFQRYNLPECIWSPTCKRLQGYFGSEDIYTEDDDYLTGHVTWFHFEVKFPFQKLISEKLVTSPDASRPSMLEKIYSNTYEWYKMGIATSWTEPNNHTIVFFDAARSVRHEIEAACEGLGETPAMGDPYWAHQFIIEPITACYDKAVWNLRDQVKALENERRNRGESVIATNPQFNELHEILRHALHATETIGVATQTLSSICNRQRSFEAEEKSFAPKKITEEIVVVARPAKRYGRGIARDLGFHLTILKSLEARAKANEARIRSEIALATSSVSQRDSQVQVEIGNAARTDSSAMKAIAIVTMLFLPSATVSALLSTSFFDFAPSEGEKVSNEFWVYWAATIPLTIFVVFFWYAWDGWQPSQRSIFASRHIAASNQAMEV